VLELEAELVDPGHVVVDEDGGAPSAGEQRRGQRGAVPGGAVDPHLPVGRHLVHPPGELVERDVLRAGDGVPALALVLATDVEDVDVVVGHRLGQALEVGDAVAAPVDAGAVAVHPAGGLRRGTVDADADQLTLRLG
jgi:hypothetical protein